MDVEDTSLFNFSLMIDGCHSFMTMVVHEYISVSIHIRVFQHKKHVAYGKASSFFRILVRGSLFPTDLDIDISRAFRDLLYFKFSIVKVCHPIAPENSILMSMTRVIAIVRLLFFTIGMAPTLSGQNGSFQRLSLVTKG